MLANELIVFLQAQRTSPGMITVFQDKVYFKEFIPIVIKLQSNFQVRDIAKAGDAVLEGYLNELF